MDGWSKISASLNSINLSQAGTKFSKGLSSGVQATRERLGQVAPDEITELPQGEPLLSLGRCSGKLTTRICYLEYKDLEARVDALKAAHLAMLKYVFFVFLFFHRFAHYTNSIQVN